MSLLGAVPVAPLVPATAGFAIGLLALLAFAVVLGLRAGYDNTLGMFLRVIADELRSIRFVGGFLAGKVDQVDRFIMARLADAAGALDTAAGKLFHASEWLVRETWNATADFAGDVAHGFTALVDVVIPEQVTERTRPLDRRLDRTRQVADERARAEAKARSVGIDRVQRDITAETRARQRGIDYIGSRIGARIDRLARTTEAQLERVWDYTRGQLAGRLGRVEALVLGGAITAAAVRALDLRFPFYKCTNVRRFNRGVCRSPLGAFDWLFATVAPALVLSDLCALSRLIQRGAEAVEPILRGLVVVADAAVECSDFGAPARLSVNAADLPSPSGMVTL